MPARPPAPKRPTLAQLWTAHPDSQERPYPCLSASGRPYFQNQCAIKMGLTLASVGVDLKAFKGARCWYQGHQHHVLRAQELADWLRTTPSLLGPVEIRRKVTHADYLGRTGLVFFKNFWGEGNQGDHIDLWDGDELRAGATDYFERSEQVWFWPLSHVPAAPAPSPSQGGGQAGSAGPHEDAHLGPPRRTP